MGKELLMWEQVQQALNGSTTRVITGIANLLPGVVALILAVAVSILVAMVLAFLIRRSLLGINFDTKLANWGFSGLSEISPAGSPTLLVVRFIYWCVVLVGALIGIAAFDATLTEQMVLRLFSYLPNFVVAVMLILFGNVIARFMARSVLIGAVNMNLAYGRLLSLGVKWLVIVLTAAMALEHLGIGGRIVDLAFAILFGGIVLALALAVGLGSKDLVSRSLEHQTIQRKEKPEEQFRHL
jgi:Mechanosensitive ion channel, conserved TM helix